MDVTKDAVLHPIIEQYGYSFLKRKYDEIAAGDGRYALLLFNIKNFRYYNTKYGSRAGDEILVLVMQKMQELLDEKEYIAYLHADYFGAVLKYTDINALLYDRMIPACDKLYRIEDERIFRNLFFSMGIYEINDSTISFEDALNYANLCRKETKNLFARCHSIESYDQSYHDRYMERIELEVKTADAYKNYEFVPYLQPKVELSTGRIVGAEALLRWFGKDGKPIPLYQFLPILNENAYIQLVDLDVLEHACEYLAQNIRLGKKVVPISFNLSKSFFYADDIVSEYIEAFEKHNLPKDLVEIELMESISLDDTERMKQIIAGFKDYGFSCSLDDFGSGYSSFNVLLNAQLDIVKMDRQFFMENLNGDNKRIIQSIIDLIHSLHMKVVAEGVETQEHIDWLKACHCDYVQGYFYYKPMSIDDFDKLLNPEGGDVSTRS